MWSNKINAISPATLLSSRNAFTARVPKTRGIVELIDGILREDGEKILARTRVLRSGQAKQKQKEQMEEEDDDAEGEREVFDDTDFYHQLLRDVVADKAGVNGMPLLSSCRVHYS